MSMTHYHFRLFFPPLKKTENSGSMPNRSTPIVLLTVGRLVISL